MASFIKMQNDIGAVFEDEEVGVEEIKAILEGYRSDPNEWEQFIKYPDSMPNRYTRHLVDAGNGKYDILILVWQKGQASPIHDHHNSDCMVKVLENELMETRFETPELGTEVTKMKQVNQAIYKTNEVTHIHDNMKQVHRMENPTCTNRTVSLHVYWPPFNTCHKFEEDSSQISDGQIVYDSVADVSGKVRSCGK